MVGQIFSVSMQSEEGVPYFGPRTFLNLFQFETTLRDSVILWRGGRTAQKRLSGAQLTIQLFFLLSQTHNKFTEMLLVTAFVVTWRPQQSWVKGNHVVKHVHLKKMMHHVFCISKTGALLISHLEHPGTPQEMGSGIWKMMFPAWI